MNLTENTLKRKENKFKTQNLQVRERNLERADPHDSLRIKLAEIYLAGDGLEIGALHKPLNIPEDKTSIRYIDRLRPQVTVSGSRGAYGACQHSR
jgi:hypothetical protein